MQPTCATPVMGLLPEKAASSAARGGVVAPDLLLPTLTLQALPRHWTGWLPVPALLVQASGKPHHCAPQVTLCAVVMIFFGLKRSTTCRSCTGTCCVPVLTCWLLQPRSCPTAPVLPEEEWT